jgi:hypothetical protein
MEGWSYAKMNDGKKWLKYSAIDGRGINRLSNKKQIKIKLELN